MFWPEQLPTTLAVMPALLELEFHGIGCMSEALEHELAVAPLPALTSLTALTVSGDEDAVCGKPGTPDWRPAVTVPALYSWLGWVLPAASQLRRLRLSCDFTAAGKSLPFWMRPILTLQLMRPHHCTNARTAPARFASKPGCFWVVHM